MPQGQKLLSRLLGKLILEAQHTSEDLKGLQPASSATLALNLPTTWCQKWDPGSCHSTWLIRTLQFLPLLPLISWSRPLILLPTMLASGFPGCSNSRTTPLAIRMHAAPDETRVRTFLYCMGPWARVILSSLMSNKAAYKSYAEVTRRLTS
ncbi:hypothetical protein MTO96_035007 [Rhipicephalus appendiculatus]